MEQLTIRTSDREQYVEITHLVDEAVRRMDCSAVMVYVSHTTAGVFINENADPDVMQDVRVAFARMVPEEAGYRHVEGNSPAHVRAILVGNSALVPVVDGRLALGTWQGIYLAEFDGPRVRTVLVVPLGSESDDFEVMKDGVILANSGHFNDEINIPALEAMAESCTTLRDFVEEYRVDGKRIILLAQGRLLNLAAAEGHPAAVMDMSFANQALSAEYLTERRDELKPGVYVVPEEIDKEIARLKLESMGVQIDVLTEEQQRYLNSWESGT